MKCVEVYKELYHQEPFDVAFCPYRISPLGAHIDHKAVLISLYESAVKNGNTAIAEEVKENFDVQVEDIAQRFRDLGLDDSLVRPSYVVNVSPLQEKINKTIRNEPEVEYHKDNEAFLKTVLSEFKMLTGEADA